MNNISFYDEGIVTISGIRYKKNCIKHTALNYSRFNFTKEKYKIQFINKQIYGIYIKK